MSDLTDDAVVRDIRIQAKASTWPSTVIEDTAGLAEALYDYEVEVLSLMATALAETPGDDQQEVYDAQEEQVAQALEFKEVCGCSSFTGTYVGANV